MRRLLRDRRGIDIMGIPLMELVGMVLLAMLLLLALGVFFGWFSGGGQKTVKSFHLLARTVEEVAFDGKFFSSNTRFITVEDGYYIVAFEKSSDKSATNCVSRGAKVIPKPCPDSSCLCLYKDDKQLRCINIMQESNGVDYFLSAYWESVKGGSDYKGRNYYNLIPGIWQNIRGGGRDLPVFFEHDYVDLNGYPLIPDKQGVLGYLSTGYAHFALYGQCGEKIIGSAVSSKPRAVYVEKVLLGNRTVIFMIPEFDAIRQRETFMRGLFQYGTGPEAVRRALDDGNFPSALRLADRLPKGPEQLLAQGDIYHRLGMKTTPEGLKALLPTLPAPTVQPQALVLAGGIDAVNSSKTDPNKLALVIASLYYQQFFSSVGDAPEYQQKALAAVALALSTGLWEPIDDADLAPSLTSTPGFGTALTWYYTWLRDVQHYTKEDADRQFKELYNGMLCAAVKLRGIENPLEAPQGLLVFLLQRIGVDLPATDGKVRELVGQSICKVPFDLADMAVAADLILKRTAVESTAENIALDGLERVCVKSVKEFPRRFLQNVAAPDKPGGVDTVINVERAKLAFDICTRYAAKYDRLRSFLQQWPTPPRELVERITTRDEALAEFDRILKSQKAAEAASNFDPALDPAAEQNVMAAINEWSAFFQRLPKELIESVYDIRIRSRLQGSRLYLFIGKAPESQSQIAESAEAFWTFIKTTPAPAEALRAALRAEISLADKEWTEKTGMSEKFAQFVIQAGKKELGARIEMYSDQIHSSFPQLSGLRTTVLLRQAYANLLTQAKNFTEADEQYLWLSDPDNHFDASAVPLAIDARKSIHTALIDNALMNIENQLITARALRTNGNTQSAAAEYSAACIDYHNLPLEHPAPSTAEQQSLLLRMHSYIANLNKEATDMLVTARESADAAVQKPVDWYCPALVAARRAQDSALYDAIVAAFADREYFQGTEKVKLAPSLCETQLNDLAALVCVI